MEKISSIKQNKLLETLESWFSDASDWDRSWRDNAKVWYNYYNGTQWTSEEEEELRSRGQAVTTYNHIAPAVDSIIGGERQNRPQVSMIGRGKEDCEVAQVKDSLYKYIQDNTNSDDEIDKMIQDAFVTGRGWMQVFPRVLADGEFDDIYHAHVDFRDMFIDQYSKRDDMADSRYVHQAVFTDEDIVKRSFPKYKPESHGNTHGFASSSDDEIWWDKSDRTRPRLIHTWYRDEKGSIHTAIWVKGQLLYSKEQPYTVSDFPYIQLTAKRSLDNLPYGLVKAMVSPQDEVNKRHSKALHYLNARQVLAEEDAFVDWNEAKKTLARPDGVTKLSDGALAEGRVQIVDNTQLAATHIQMMEHSKGQILALAGINSSFLGQGGQYESAKKTQMNVSGASGTLVPLFNKIRIFRHRLAKLTMALVPDFYTDERIIRVATPQGQYAFMPVNQPQLLADGVTIGLLNDLTKDDVDVIIEDAPSGLNDRIEQFNQLLGIQGQTGRPIPMEILLRYSSLKDKNELAAELEQHYAMEAQIQQVQQYAQQLEQQVQQLGGVINQKDSQIVQINTARAVDKEVAKAKSEIEKEKNTIKEMM